MNSLIKNIKPLFYCFFIIVALSCSSSGEEEAPPVERTANDVIEDFKKLTINPGVNDLSLESTFSGYFWDFRLIAPQNSSSTDKKPLILRLHGSARSNAPEAHKSTDCLVEPGFENVDAYILSPNSKALQWYEDANVFQILALVDLVKTYLNVDINKTAVMGYSDGGNASWYFAQFYPELFKAAIPIATSYDTTTSAGVTKIDIPLYVIHGEEDDLFPIEVTEGYVNASKDAGTDVTFVRAPGLVHNKPCDYVPYLKDAVAWLENSVW
jgi:predicted peptidase